VHIASDRGGVSEHGSAALRGAPSTSSLPFTSATCDGLLAASLRFPLASALDGPPRAALGVDHPLKPQLSKRGYFLRRVF